MRYIKALLIPAVTLTLFSCSKEWKPDGGARVAVMTLSPSDGGAATRSNIDTTAVPGNKKVTWSVADEIYWWTSPDVSGTPGDKRKYTVLADAESVEIPVSYNDNDQYVTFYTAGRGVGGGTTSDMTQLTFSVPQQQDGTFASNHVAVHKSQVILSAPAAAMKPVATMLRFTLSTLTCAGKTVDNIHIGCMDGTSRLWGDFKVTMDNASLGSVSAVDKIDDAGTEATPIIIDKRATAFQTGIPYYVAVRPNTAAWPQGIYFDLYNGGTKLARVIVRDSAAGGLTLAHGRIRDLGDLKTHANIPTTAAQMTMYPPYAAFTKNTPAGGIGKKFWLRVEPEDFSGEIEWTKGGTNPDAFDLVPGNKENVTIDGKTVSCWTAILKPTAAVMEETEYNLYTTTLTATASEFGMPSQSVSVNDIEMGRFIDVGCVDEDGNRILWANGDISGSYDDNHWNFGTETYSESTCSLIQNTDEGTSGNFWWWGYLHLATTVTDGYHRWEAGAGAENYRTDYSGGKYYSGNYVVLEDVDNVAKYMWRIYPEYDKEQWDIPRAIDWKILISICNTSNGASTHDRYTPKSFMFQDCYVRKHYDRGYLCKDGEVTNGWCTAFRVAEDVTGIMQSNRNRENNRLRLIRRVPKNP